jgi:hypothetical protein
MEVGGWSTPHPGRFTPEKDPVPVAQEAGWAPGPVWTCAKNLASTGIRSPDIPARSSSLYRLSCRGMFKCIVIQLYDPYIHIFHWHTSSYSVCSYLSRPATTDIPVIFDIHKHSFLKEQPNPNVFISLCSYSVNKITLLLGVMHNRISFLSAFAKLRKATISFVMSVCPSVRASFVEENSAHTAFLCNFIVEILFFQKSVHEIQVSL